MRRYLPFPILFALACNTLMPTATPLPPPTPTASVAAALPTAVPSARPTAAPVATVIPPQPDGLQPGDITFHPGPELYAGDIVSFEVDGSNVAASWEGWRVEAYLGGADGEKLGESDLASFGFGGAPAAEFWWAWDTAGLVGEQTLTFVALPPDEAGTPQQATVSVLLLPAELRPQPEREAAWALAESACCLFHYLTGTAAARDIETIKAEADESFEIVEARLGVERRDKIAFTLLSRLLGHGGFASGEISLTYVDRNPAGNNFDTVFIHEGVHILDRQFADNRPAFLAEGLAVFIAGGHYKPEDLDRRAAALLAWEGYLPLADLARDFYPAQHEIGYLEAGSFVKYLVDQYGWDRFKKMYATLQPAPDETVQLANGLAAHYEKTLAELETEWLAYLRTVAWEARDLDDLRLSVGLFEALRRYQQLRDPAAYYLSAWLPDGPQARKRGVIADFIRSPRDPEAIALETMLAAAERGLARGDFAQVAALLTSVNAALDANDLNADPLAARYLRVVAELAAEGYEAQTIELLTDLPTLTAIRDWPVVESVTYNGQ
jgi:hypothetical protein